MLNESTLKAMRGALFMRQGTLTKDTEAALGTTQALSLVDALIAGDTIASLWSVDDVYSLDDENFTDTGDYTGNITVEQAREVLRLAERKHDASIGINWDTLGYWLEEVRNA